jgi:hypothetical protein
VEFVSALAFFAVISAPVVAVIAGIRFLWCPPARRHAAQQKPMPLASSGPNQALKADATSAPERPLDAVR